MVSNFFLQNIVNTNSYVTDIFAVRGYDIVVTNFSYDNVIEISFGVEPVANASGEKKQMIV